MVRRSRAMTLGGRCRARGRRRALPVATDLAGLEGPAHDRGRDAVHLGAAELRPRPRRDAEAQAGHGLVAARRRASVGEEQEAALGAGDVHDRVEHLLQHLAQDQRRVQGLDEREQELLLLDPRELGDRAGRVSRSPSSENFRVTLPSWTWAPGRAPPAATLAGVHVDAVEAARVLDEEAAVLVLDAGVELGDRGLVEARSLWRARPTV